MPDSEKWDTDDYARLALYLALISVVLVTAYLDYQAGGVTTQAAAEYASDIGESLKGITELPNMIH